MIMLKKTTKDTENKINPTPKSTRARMYSYEWNYMVLEIVDYLEEKLNQVESCDDPDSAQWKNFKDYCTRNDLNWRVIRKMIEFSINTPLKSERELANHESFKALEKIKDEPVVASENNRNEPEKVLKNKEKESKEEVLNLDF